MRERTDRNIASIKNDYLLGLISHAEAIDQLDALEYREPADIVANWDKPDSRDPDHSRSGMFVHHNCWACLSGKRPCVNDNPRSCEYPQARNA